MAQESKQSEKNQSPVQSNIINLKSEKTWEDLKIDQKLIDQLKAEKYDKPSKTQE